MPKPVIDRVEVVRGASSSLFGSYAMGSVVNIVTAAPNKNEGNVETLYGQNNRFQGNFDYGYVVNDGGIQLQRQLLRHQRVLPGSEKPDRAGQRTVGRTDFKMSRGRRI